MLEKSRTDFRHANANANSSQFRMGRPGRCAATQTCLSASRRAPTSELGANAQEGAFAEGLVADAAERVVELDALLVE
jgi:hypothetical protein